MVRYEELIKERVDFKLIGSLDLISYIKSSVDARLIKLVPIDV